MKIIRSKFPDVMKIIPEIYEDNRGSFTEIFNEEYPKHAFVQDNISVSKEGVLRGLHYQVRRPQGKLVTCLSGFVFDVVVDITPDSIYFGQWEGFMLNGFKKEQLWIPQGFAHGFYVSMGDATIMYKTTDYYFPQGERTILWNDPDLNISWNVLNPIISEKDSKGKLFKDIDVEELYKNP
jgi:dTDP-4-dehydrorhamnose 3,5-epimerase